METHWGLGGDPATLYLCTFFIGQQMVLNHTRYITRGGGGGTMAALRPPPWIYVSRRRTKPQRLPRPSFTFSSAVETECLPLIVDGDGSPCCIQEGVKHL